MMATLDNELETIYDELGDLKKSVEVIRGGWERLTKSNEEMASRMESIAQTLERIESFHRADKAFGKSIAGPSNPEVQVHSSFPPLVSEDPQLGYRRIADSLETRNNLLKKVELPNFVGVNPNVWINRAERYFRLGRFSDLDKFDLLAVSFEGAVLNWFNIEMEEDPFTDWQNFKERLLLRFKQRIEDEPGKRLFAITQKGSVGDYINEFEELRSMVTGIAEKNLVDVFFNGLKQEMKEVVKMKEPRGLRQHMAAVMTMEDSAFCKSIAAVSHTVTTPKATGYIPLRSSTQHNTNNQVVASGNKDQQGQRQQKPGPRRLTPAELAEKRRLGLCYKCDSKWSKTHECKNVELQVLTVVDGFEVEVFNESGADTFEDENGVVTDLMVMSLASFFGLSSPTTTKLWGKIGELMIIVMLDSGATHNFLSPAVVTQLNITPVRDRRLEIILGTGITVNGTGVCKDVTFSLPVLEDTADFIMLELGRVDMILGVQWLRTLGRCEVDWETHEMSFIFKGERVTLYGDSSLQNGHVCPQAPPQDKSQLNGIDVEFFQVNTSDAQPEIPLPIEHLLDRYLKVFAEPSQLPPLRDREHAINLVAGAGPISVRPYRYPHSYKEEMEKMVSQMLQSGIIRPSHSPYSSPVLLVKKKDGTWRFCIDYRALNKVTVADKFPIPMIDQLLDELFGAKIFSKLDLRSGYHQIRMQEKDIHKTAFRTADGHYEFVVMPFGLTNAPATFQALMNEIFRPYLRKFILVFFDDILIYSKTVEEHVQHLEIVLKLFETHKLFANKKKCLFGQSQVDYLGHLISADGVSTDPEKTEAMRKWPIPRTVKDLRGFLGLTGYYRRFVQSYGSIARPLTCLLKKDAFEWSELTNRAFEGLKKAMSTAPVLALPDFSETFVVESDASGYGIGAVLMQKGRPVAYFSAGLTDREQIKPIYERELMAVVLAIQKWRHYLLGRKFIVHTDQKSLKFLLEQREVSLDYQRWLTKLLGYDFDIVFKPGVENKAADGLSRIGSRESELSGLSLAALTVPSSIQMQDILTEIDQSAELKELKSRVEQGKMKKPGYSVVQGRVFYKERLLLAKSSVHVPAILREYHDSVMGGHSGVLKTVRRIQSVFHWRKMTQDIQAYVAACDICQRHKYSTLTPAGLLQPLPSPTQVWEGLSMDFIEGLPVSNGVNVILVVVDRLSKFAHFLSLKHPFSAVDVANLFLKEIVRLHGFPGSIVSDRDRIFLSSFWKSLFRLGGTQLKYSTAFHPQSDGQTEVLNRCLETYLRCYASAHPKSWAKYLPWAELWYNTNFHTALGTTPFRVVYGRDPPSLLKFEEGSTANFDLECMLKQRDAMLKQIKGHLLLAQDRMKTNADKHRRELEFQVGDKVFLKLRPYRQQSVVKRLYQKLAARYFGPFEVIGKVGAVAYRLQLPEGSRIHNVFHVSQLKPVIGQGHTVSELPRTLSSNDELVVEPEDVLDTRYDAHGCLEALVSWTGLPEHENSWEKAVLLLQQFPHLKLEDKLRFDAAGIDRPLRVYTRKRGRREERLNEEE